MLFAKALKGADVGELLSNIATAAPAGAAAAGPAAAAAEVVVEEVKKEEVEDVDMGGLFGDEDEYWDNFKGENTSLSIMINVSTHRFRVS